MRVIIAGTRDFSNYFLLKEKCDYYLSNTNEKITVISGGARGADKLGERYAKEKRYNLDIYPADWDKYGKSAGYIRNKNMAVNADACIIFWDGQSKGSKHMYDICIEQNIPVRLIKY